MGKGLVLVVLAWLASTPCAGAGEPGPEGWIRESRLAAQGLGGALMRELSAALAVSPLEAISVCSARAPAIAAEQSARLGAKVGRTALRVRNPANAPAPWQREALEDFARQLEAGADAAGLEYALEVVVDGATERRWMKPIMTAPLCLTCHGDALDPELAAVIAERYPEDRATGFTPGELRGAFYVVWLETVRE